MIVYSDKFEIGKAGFDVISLIGFELPSKTYEEPVIDHCIQDSTGEYSTGINEVKGIKATRKKVIIKGTMDMNKTLCYTLRFGNQGKRPFMNLTIYSRIFGIIKYANLNGDFGDISTNIKNMSVGDVWKAMKLIESDLQEKFGFYLMYLPEDIRIISAEINKTFFADFPFTSYKKSFDMMSRTCYEHKKNMRNSKKAVYSSGDSKEDVETYYIFIGSTISIKAYDKGRAIDEKDVPAEINKGSLMRVEISSKQQNLTKLSGDDEVYLYKCTDERIENYFAGYMRPIFTIIDDKLNKFYNYDLKDLNSSSEMSTINPDLPEIYKCLLNSAFELIHDCGQSQMLSKTILTNLFVKETNTHEVLLQDLGQLITYLDKEPVINHRYKRCMLQDLNDKYYGSGWEDSDPEKIYMQESNTYGEIKDKLINYCNQTLVWKVDIDENGLVTHYIERAE